MADDVQMGVKSTHELYLESLAQPSDPPKHMDSVGPEGVLAPTKSGFVAVSPEYQNFANKTEKPLAAQGGGAGAAEAAYAASFEGGNEPGDALKAAYADVTHTDTK
jgi:hypothetical protein